MAIKSALDNTITSLANKLPGPLKPTATGEQQSKANMIAQKKAECSARGGQWDEATQSCILPTPPANNSNRNTGEQQSKAKLTSPETFSSSDTGRASGIVLSNGKTFLGLGPQDVNQVAAGEAARVARPEGTNPVGTAQNQLQQQQRFQELTQMAQQGLLTPNELNAIQGANVDVGQAIGAGVAGVIPGLIGGAAGGAAIGAAGAGVGAIPGAVIGGIGGALTGFLTSIRSNIKSQQTSQFAADQTALSKGQTFLKSLITDTNQNPQNAAENIELFYQTLNLIDAAHVKTWRDSQENLNKFLGNDGTQQLAKFNTFDDTMRTYYVNQFLAALNTPDPNRSLITVEDLGIE